MDEAVELGLTMEPSVTVATPRVGDSPVSIECHVHSEVDLGDSVVVLGQVRAVTVLEQALDERGLPTMDALRPVSRLGRNEWGLPPGVVRMDRPGVP